FGHRKRSARADSFFMTIILKTWGRNSCPTRVKVRSIPELDSSVERTSETRENPTLARLPSFPILFVEHVLNAAEQRELTHTGYLSQIVLRAHVPNVVGWEFARAAVRRFLHGIRRIGELLIHVVSIESKRQRI